MICTNCKRTVPEQAAYCPYCGTVLSAAVTAKRKRRKGLVALPVCLLLCLVAFGVFWYLSGQETQSYIGTEKGTALTDEEAESILLGDISDEDWEIFEASVEEICQIVAEYSNEDGYVDPDDTETVLNAVAKQVDTLYKKGAVAYYVCDSDMISFEFASGLTAYFEPALEGYLAGSGTEDFVNIVTLDPWSTDMGDSVISWAAIGGNYISASLTDMEMLNLTDSNQSGGVMLETLESLPESEFFLWLGHGGSDGTTLNLATAQSYADTSGTEDVSVGIIEVGISGFGAYWAIEPAFVTQFLSLNDGLVYLAACHTGENDSFADAFESVGAKTVFVNAGSGEVEKFYTINMMLFILKYMSAREDGIYHTAAEALTLANEDFQAYFSGDGDIEVQYNVKGGNRVVTGYKLSTYKSLDDYVQALQNGAHVEIRGDEDYTIVSTILVSIAFDDYYSAKEQTDFLPYLSVRLTAEDGTYKDYTPDEVDFFINKMAPGTYTATLYEGETVVDEQTVEVESHHRAEVTLYYSALVTLEGYVYDTDGAPLSGVTVSAEDATGGSDVWSAETRTDDNGYYALKVYGENTYALTYSKSGYTEQETTFQITPELFEQAQEGTPYTLEDVILGATVLTGFVVDAESGEALSGVSVSVYDTSFNSLVARPKTTTASDGSFSLLITWEGDYSVEFEMDGYESVAVTGSISNAEPTDLGTISLAALTEDDEVGLSSGVYAYATSVVEFTEGVPWTSDPDASDPSEALGVPNWSNDKNAVTLGAGGILVLAFDVDICDGEGIDIYVYESGGDVEPTLVEVSNDLVNWTVAGTAEGSLSGVDLNGMVPEGANFRYVRLTDLGNYPSGTWPGADIDAVAIVNYK